MARSDIQLTGLRFRVSKSMKLLLHTQIKRLCHIMPHLQKTPTVANRNCQNHLDILSRWMQPTDYWQLFQKFLKRRRWWAARRSAANRIPAATWLASLQHVSVGLNTHEAAVGRSFTQPRGIGQSFHPECCGSRLCSAYKCSAGWKPDPVKAGHYHFSSN